jgi:peptidoglycan/xylan/chitin deacetylase (PgdA/CDA1 family)
MRQVAINTKLVKSALGMAFTATGAFQQKVGKQETIVAFHRVNDSMPANDSLTCGSEMFSEFCGFFKEHYDIVPLAEQIRSCREGSPRSGTLSITFDDGYLDNFQVAAPILKDLGLPATFFVTTGFIQSTVVPFWDKDLPKQPGWMSWAHVRDLADSGFDIGCHTATHIDLGTCGAEEVRTELRESKTILEQRLSRPVTLFAYPFGARTNINQTSLDVVREEGFECCVSCCGGTNSGATDPFSLNRLPISGWFSRPHQMAAEIVLNKI